MAGYFMKCGEKVLRKRCATFAQQTNARTQHRIYDDLNTVGYNHLTVFSKIYGNQAYDHKHLAAISSNQILKICKGEYCKRKQTFHYDLCR